MLTRRCLWMRHSDVIYLLSTEIIYDDYGIPKKNTQERKVFANKMSVSATEFYNAGVHGLKPERQFEIYTFEYQEETQLMHEGKKYNIIRTQSKGEKLRLICERD